MNNNEQDKLKATLAKLELSIQKVLGTRGYSHDAKSLKLLENSIRESLTNENTRSANRHGR
ncbi:MAG: hypothetical protein AB7G93_17690 [Bdellovibrionales bacterium]